MNGTSKPSNAADAVGAAQAARFAAALARLAPECGRLGLAVSGGPDSLALLLLAHAAIPGAFEVATVDHGLRPEAAGEAAFVARTCAALGVPHATLPVEVAAGNLQDEARRARYAALAAWAADRGLDALATAHHADDQAETMLMRLNRGSGLAGLAGVRARGVVPGGDLPVLRPLLDWRRAELATIVAAAGIAAVADPSNADPQFDRVRMRRALASADWLDPASLAASASHLAEAEDALEEFAALLWSMHVRSEGGVYSFDPVAPRAMRLRIVERIIAELGKRPRGGEVARLLDKLERGEGGTLGGVLARVESPLWTFRREPPRRGG